MRNAFWIFIFALLILVVFLPTFSKKQQLQEKNDQLQAEINSLKEHNAALMAEQKLLEEDPVYLEKVAREKMGVVREGEVIYKINQIPMESGK